MADGNTRTITLNQPIKRGETEISSVTLRKPGAGELRRLSLNDVLNSDVDTHIKLLPRISGPALTEAELAAMPIDDFAELASAVVGFSLGSVRKAALGLEI